MIYSLEFPVGEDEYHCLGEFIEDEETPPPMDEVTREMLREQLEEVFDSLTPREVEVLRLRFGLGGDYEQTLDEVGKKIGVTRERARQIVAKALRKLRHPYRSRKLRNYLE